MRSAVSFLPLATARSSGASKPYPSHSHPFKLPSVVRRLQCFPHWQPSKYPHSTKSTVAIAVVRKFFIAGKLSPHRVSLSSRFNHAQEAEHHRAFPKNPTDLDALWYESGAMQNIPVPTQNGFLDERPCVHLTERGKKQGLKTRTEVVTVCCPAGCAVSSVGRALPRHGRGHWFKSSTAHHFSHQGV